MFNQRAMFNNPNERLFDDSEDSDVEEVPPPRPPVPQVPDGPSPRHLPVPRPSPPSPRHLPVQRGRVAVDSDDESEDIPPRIPTPMHMGYPGYDDDGRPLTPMHPGYSPTSPSYSPTSPRYSPTSPSYSPTSPAPPSEAEEEDEELQEADLPTWIRPYSHAPPGPIEPRNEWTHPKLNHDYQGNTKLHLERAQAASQMPQFCKPGQKVGGQALYNAWHRIQCEEKLRPLNLPRAERQELIKGDLQSGWRDVCDKYIYYQIAIRRTELNAWTLAKEKQGGSSSAAPMSKAEGKKKQRPVVAQDDSSDDDEPLVRKVPVKTVVRKPLYKPSAKCAQKQSSSSCGTDDGSDMPPELQAVMLQAYNGMRKAQKQKEESLLADLQQANKNTEDYKILAHDWEKEARKKRQELDGATQRISDLNNELTNMTSNHNQLRTDVTVLGKRAVDAEADRDTALERARDSDAAVFGMAKATTTMCRRMVEATDASRKRAKPMYEKAGCVCCLDQTAVWAIVPCGHLVVCDGCKPRIENDDKCPQCRGDTLGGDHGFLRIYSSGVDIFECEEEGSEGEPSVVVD